eukprot:Seg3532.1 transcript_id=Seg3532.1/GoldUCD/mRNA.D3Y31 product="hypothetical protein" protein_id=Seg3532.1/GoldUCD/D3Y31
MGIDLYLLFGEVNCNEREESDHGGNCYIREGYGRAPYISKLLFPKAFSEEDEGDDEGLMGVKCYARPAIDLFYEKGIPMLKEKYGINYPILMNRLKSWIGFLTLMFNQEIDLGSPCGIYASY